MYSIARNLALRKLRQEISAGPEKLAFREGFNCDCPADVVERKDAASRVRVAIKRLKSELRVVLELRYWHNMKITDIASFLDIPEATVKWRLQKSKALLRHELGDYGGGWNNGKGT
jgi:RNA polymerase sigma factor (sigma-70 family)